MTLASDERKSIIEYRKEKSYATLKEAIDNASLGNWSLAANRLYYSVFYMVLAVNLSHGESAKTHNGTFNLFSKTYIASGTLSKEDGSLYRLLFSMRQTGDYDDLFDWTEEDVKPLIPKVKSFLEKIEKLI